MKHELKIIVLSLIVGFIIYYLYSQIFYFAYLSTIASCNLEKFEIKFSDYEIGGKFSTNISETGDVETSIIILQENPKRSLLKHELCHQRQYNLNYLGNCDSKWLLYLNEVECYTTQRFWELFD